MVDGKPFEVVGIVRYEGLRAGGETGQPYLFGSDIGRRQQGSLFVRVKGDASLPSPPSDARSWRWMRPYQSTRRCR